MEASHADLEVTCGTGGPTPPDAFEAFAPFPDALKHPHITQSNSSVRDLSVAEDKV